MLTACFIATILFVALYAIDQRQKGLNLNSLAGVVVVLLAALFGILANVPSISIDLSVIFENASAIVTMMMPIVGIGAGISFGFALVAYIIRLFRQVF